MRHQASLFAGISLFISFCILSASKHLQSLLSNTTAVVVILEAAAFILPVILLRSFQKGKYVLDFRLHMPKRPGITILFTISSALAVSLLAFTVNYWILGLTGYNTTRLSVGMVNVTLSYNLTEFLAVVVFSAVVEEIYFRGALFSSYEKAAGSSMCILTNGIMFGIMHGSVFNLLGPILCGIFYAWLTYTFQSIIPAILAHLIHNTLYYTLQNLSDTFSVFGIWRYLPFIALISFFFFAWLAFYQAEALLDKKLFFALKKSRNIGLATFFEIVLTPGFLAFTLAFVFKSVLKVL